MKILIKKSVSGIYGSFVKGDELEIEDKIAESFIAGGIAASLDSAKTPEPDENKEPESPKDGKGGGISNEDETAESGKKSKK